ncbi:hypothetical protein DDI_3010 [Dickeya dianthicola RNS04.9]|nr:hypothetical protein DDI_3010 [Dickeya dianthicola RNS04.9]
MGLGAMAPGGKRMKKMQVADEKKSARIANPEKTESLA